MRESSSSSAKSGRVMLAGRSEEKSGVSGRLFAGWERARDGESVRSVRMMLG